MIVPGDCSALETVCDLPQWHQEMIATRNIMWKETYFPYTLITVPGLKSLFYCLKINAVQDWGYIRTS